MKIVKFIFLIVFIFCTSHTVFSQDNEVKWITNMNQAIELAKEQNKKVLLLWGSNTCGYCTKATRFLNQDPTLKKLIEEKYVPWFCNFDKSEEGDKYRLLYDFDIPPLVCIINPHEPATPEAYITGDTTINKLITLLD